MKVDVLNTNETGTWLKEVIFGGVRAPTQLKPKAVSIGYSAYP